MVGGSWQDPDGVYRQYGTTKAIAETTGEFQSLGESRIIETNLDLTTLVLTTPTIISRTCFFPLVSATNAQKMLLEAVEVETLTGFVSAGGATGFSMGLTSSLDGTTAITPNAGVQIVNNLLNAQFTTSGQKVTFNFPGASGISGAAVAVAGGGAYLGTCPTNTNTPVQNNAYLSAFTTGGTGVYTAGLLKVRMKYSFYGQIVQ